MQRALGALLALCLVFAASPRLVDQMASAAGVSASRASAAVTNAKPLCEQERHPAGHRDHKDECCAFCRAFSDDPALAIVALVVVDLAIDYSTPPGLVAARNESLPTLHEGALTAWAATAPPTA